MRVLVIDADVVARAAAVREHASRRPYVPGAMVPGDDPNHIIQIGDYRAVFSLTRLDGRLYRHISVSVPGTKFPNPVACWMLADLFGFSGWDGRATEPPDSWATMANKKERCVVVVQEILQ